METPDQLATVKKVPISADERGIELRSLDDMWRFATAIVNSKQFKNIDTPETAVILLQAGAELGLSPIWACSNIFVIAGRPSVFGDALLGIVLAHPDCVDVIETMDGAGDQMEATCEVQRRNRLPVKRTFSVSDAKKAALWGKAGPWQSYPKRMLQMRARSWACRDSFADALRGLGVVEELRDTEPKTVVGRTIERPKLVLPDEPAPAVEVQVEPEPPPLKPCDWLHEDPPCSDDCWIHKRVQSSKTRPGELL